jgi:hypothetical protein
LVEVSRICEERVTDLTAFKTEVWVSGSVA